MGRNIGQINLSYPDTVGLPVAPRTLMEYCERLITVHRSVKR